MCARQTRFVADAFGGDIKKVLPVINPNGSDSAMFDSTLEHFHLAGRCLPHAVMMMISEPWSYYATLDDSRSSPSR